LCRPERPPPRRAATPRRPLRAATRGGSRDWARLAADATRTSTAIRRPSRPHAGRSPGPAQHGCRNGGDRVADRGIPPQVECGSPHTAGARPEASLSLPKIYVLLSQFRCCMLGLLTCRKSRLTVLGVFCWLAGESGGYGVGHGYPGLSQGKDSALPPDPAHRLPLMQSDPVRSASVELIEGSVGHYRGRRPHGMHLGGRSMTSSSPASGPVIEATRGQE
jgi:hypothetical protein